jgi:hypothetical protein
VGLVLYIGDMKNEYKISDGILQERYHFLDLGINRRILKWILEKDCVIIWTGFTWFKIQLSEHSFELSGSIKSVYFSAT